MSGHAPPQQSTARGSSEMVLEIDGSSSCSSSSKGIEPSQLFDVGDHEVFGVEEPKIQFADAAARSRAAQPAVLDALGGIG